MISYRFLGILLAPGLLMALPSGIASSVGKIDVAIEDACMSITAADRAIINYEAFHIASDETLRFVQPNASSCVLNRVVGKDASSILGRMHANGNVFFVNPNGVYFGPDSEVHVGSIVVSTLDIADQHFLDEKYCFSLKEKESFSSIQNEGSILAETNALFLAPIIKNTGSIIARMGKVALLSGEQITLDFANDGLVSFAIDGALEEALIEHTGKIEASQGKVRIKEDAARRAMDEILNMDGVEAAVEIVETEFGVYLAAGQGTCNVSGSIHATHKEKIGGEIQLLGDRVHLSSQAKIDASGKMGGGSVLIGSKTTGGLAHVDSTVQIHADAIKGGNGGRIHIWGREVQFAGLASVQGGNSEGRGGKIEISKSCSLPSPLRAGGLMLSEDTLGTFTFDASNIEIGCNSLPGYSCISALAIQEALAQNHVQLHAIADAEGGGMVMWSENAPVRWSSPATLTCTADRAMELHSTIENSAEAAFTAIHMLASPLHISIEGSIGIEVGNGAVLASLQGDIILDGFGDAVGVQIVQGGKLQSTGEGQGAAKILVKGEGAIGVKMSGAESLMSSLSGSVTIQADTVQILDGLIQTEGEAVFEPLHPETSIGINGGAGTLSLSKEALDRIYPGAQSVRIGRSDGTGATTIQAIALNANGYVFTNQSIVIEGAVTAEDEMPLTLMADALSIQAPINGSGILTLEPKTAGHHLGFGDGSSGDWIFDASSLSRFGSGWQSVVFGHAASTGTIELKAATLSAHTKIFGKTIQVQGTVQANDRNVTLQFGSATEGVLHLDAPILTSGLVEIIGSDYDDQFFIQTTENQSLAIDGRGGVNQLFGPDRQNAWILAAPCSGSLNATISFANIQGIFGGAFGNTFTLSGPIEFPGGIDGNAGINSIQGPNLATLWTLSNDDAGLILPEGAASPTSFIHVGTLQGGLGSNTFAVAGLFRFSGSIIGGSSSLDTVIGPETALAWSLTESNGGSMSYVGQMNGADAIRFANVGNLVGGSISNLFTFMQAAAFNGQLGIQGKTPNDEIQGPDACGGQWSITGNNAGGLYFSDMGQTRFSGISKIIGGSGNDAFLVSGPFQMTRGIVGGSGENSLSGPATRTSWMIQDNDQGRILPEGAAGPTDFTQIGSLYGGLSSNTFMFQGSYFLSGGIYGQSQMDQIVGPSTSANIWTLQGLNAGTLLPLQSQATQFSGIIHLIGGNAGNTFVWNPGASIYGMIDGGGTSSNILDYSAFSSQVHVDLHTGMSTGMTGMRRIQLIIGGQGANQITGPDQPNEWTLLTDDSRTLNGNLHLIHFQSLVGGDQDILIGPDVINVWTITGNNQGVLEPEGWEPIQFNHIGGLVGGAVQNTFIFNGPYQLEPGITGGALSDQIQGPQVRSTWNITNNESGTIYPFASTGPTLFQAIPWIESRSGNDLFQFSGPFQLSGGIQGALGNSDTIVSCNGAATTWSITGDDAGTMFSNGAIGATSFTQVANLIGGDFPNTFILTGPVQISGTQGLVGHSGQDAVRGPDVATVWSILGNDAGTIAPSGAGGSTIFSGIGRIEGGAESNTYLFNNAFLLTGGIVGTAMDTIHSSSNGTTWVLTDDDSGTMAPNHFSGSTQFSGVGSLVSGSGHDTFIYNGPYCLHGAIGIRGQGEDLIIGSATTPNIWTILNSTEGTILPAGATAATAFAGVVVLQGGPIANTFLVAGSGDGTHSWQIVGGSALDELIGPNAINIWALREHQAGSLSSDGHQMLSFSGLPRCTGGAIDDTFVLEEACQFQAIQGGSGSSRMQGPSMACAWTISGEDAGTILPDGVADATAFSRIGTLIGGNLPNVFTLNESAQLSGKITGGGSNQDQIIGPDVDTTWTISDRWGGNIQSNGVPGSIHFEQIPYLKGSVTSNLFTFSETGTVLEVSGQQGIGTVQGPNVAASWIITGQNQGSLMWNGKAAVQFIGICQLIGGSEVNTFSWSGNHQLTGSPGITGGSSEDEIIGPHPFTALISAPRCGKIVPHDASEAAVQKVPEEVFLDDAVVSKSEPKKQMISKNLQSATDFINIKTIRDSNGTVFIFE